MRRYLLSKLHTKNLEQYRVYENTILISCSGTVGNVAFVTKDIDGWTVSQHAIRVIAQDEIDLGMMYCYFQSSLGQFLLKRSKSGSVIDSIYEQDVASLPIPFLPQRLREELTRRIKQAAALRMEANRLLDEAEREVGSRNNLKAISNIDTISFIGNISSISTQQVYKGQLRLDISPFSPAVSDIQDDLSKSNSSRLASLASEIIYIGKVYRVPVDAKEHGAPLLGGKDLTLLRPAEDKYISILNSEHINRCLIPKDVILVSRSGNIGRISMSHRNFEGFVGSEDVLRVIPDTSQIDPFYLCAFLSSPWGEVQIKSLIYGSVILHISKEHLGSIRVPIPDDKGVSIGKKVMAAYDARADALEIEDSAFDLFMQAIQQGHKKTAAEWGQ